MSRPAVPSTSASKRVGHRFWYDFAVFYIGVLWLPSWWSPRGVTFAVVTVLAVAVYLAWAAWHGSRGYLAARMLCASGALAPILGLAYPTWQGAAEFLMILLMTVAGFASMRAQQQAHTLLSRRIAQRRLDVP